MINTYKGVNKINNILNDFLEEFDAYAEMGHDFAYIYAKNQIEYTLLLDDNSETYFMNNFHKMAPDIDCDPFLVSILHELGHHETLDDIDMFEEIYCLAEKDTITERYVNKDFSSEQELYDAYFNLTDEYEATTWAINYIRENAEKVKELWNKLKPAIDNFYKLNAVEGI